MRGRKGPAKIPAAFEMTMMQPSMLRGRYAKLQRCGEWLAAQKPLLHHVVWWAVRCVVVYLFVCCFAGATCRDRQQPQRLQLRADELRKHITIRQAASGQLNHTHARTQARTHARTPARPHARTKPLLHLRVVCLFVPFVVLCAIPELGRGDIPATHAVPKVGTDHVDHMADSLACNQWELWSHGIAFENQKHRDSRLPFTVFM
jgi:hypothetical protein